MVRHCPSVQKGFSSRIVLVYATVSTDRQCVTHLKATVPTTSVTEAGQTLPTVKPVLTHCTCALTAHAHT